MEQVAPGLNKAYFSFPRLFPPYREGHVCFLLMHSSPLPVWGVGCRSAMLFNGYENRVIPGPVAY